MLWVFGLIGLAAAAACGWVARRANGRVQAMESVETLPVRDLRTLCRAAADAAGPGNFRQPCELAGVTRPHKNGSLRSELEQLECVWHRHEIIRKYEEYHRDSNGNQQRRTRTEVVSGYSSSTAFFVEDATGRLAVRPGRQVVDGAEQVLDTFVPHRGGSRVSIGSFSFDLGGGGGTLGYQKREWIIRPGVRFFVHGEASDENGPLAVAAPAEGGTFILSARSEKELTRSENNKILGFGIAAGVLGVAGAVLTVVGLVA